MSILSLPAKSGRVFSLSSKGAVDSGLESGKRMGTNGRISDSSVDAFDLSLKAADGIEKQGGTELNEVKESLNRLTKAGLLETDGIRWGRPRNRTGLDRSL